MDADELMFEVMVRVGLRAAERTGHFQVIMRGPAGIWHLRDAAREAPPGYAWVTSVCRGDDPMGACKRYYGRRNFAPTNLAVVDTRPRKPPVDAAPPSGTTPPPAPPTFYHYAPDPGPMTHATAPGGPVRQATFFDD